VDGRSELKSARISADVELVGGKFEVSQGGEPLLLARLEAVRRRAGSLSDVKLRQRSGRYWLDRIQGNMFSISPPMSLDELEQELARLDKNPVDDVDG
jgi:hypothetical protein